MEDQNILNLLFNPPLFVDTEEESTLYTAIINVNTNEQKEYIWE